LLLSTKFPTMPVYCTFCYFHKAKLNERYAVYLRAGEVYG
jgi:hypothetical protein